MCVTDSLEREKEMDDYLCVAGTCALFYMCFGGDRNRPRAPPRPHNPHACPHCDQYGRYHANRHGRPHASPYSPHADAQCGSYGPPPGYGAGGRPYAPSAAAYNSAPPGVQFPPEYNPSARHVPTAVPQGYPVQPGYPAPGTQPTGYPPAVPPPPMPPQQQGNTYVYDPYAGGAVPPAGYPTNPV